MVWPGPERDLPRALFLAMAGMCGWRLVRTGWPSLAVAGGLASVGLAVGPSRPDRGAAASPAAPRPEDGRAD